MKAIIFALFLIVLTLAQSPELLKCIQEKCTDQYNKCLQAKGCEDKLNKCALKCGEKVDYPCWSLCLGLLPGPSTNVALCAGNNCFAKVSKIEIFGLNLMQAIYAISQE